MKLLSLDLSTSTGFAVFEDNKLIESGNFQVDIADFNVQNYPEKSPNYPWNIMAAATEVARKVGELIERVQPTNIVAENTVCGRNRHTQRLLEWIHWCVLIMLTMRFSQIKFGYIDVSEWRSIIGLYMTKEDKKNNRDVSTGKKPRGKITKKHLSVRYANETFGLALKLKDNDIADAACQGWAYLKKLSTPSC